MSARLVCAVLGICLLSGVPVHGQSSAQELNDAGWKKLQEGDGAAAQRLFARALAMMPDEPVLLFGSSVAFQLQGRRDQAKPRLRRALDVNPRFTPASLLLGEIVYSEGNLDEAIRIYERALTLSPGNPDLTSRLDTWRHEADVHRSFKERREDRFHVLFEGPIETGLATQATDILTTAFWRIGEALGAYPSDTIVVILYTEQQFRDVTRAPEWSGGLYDGRIRVPTAGATLRPRLFERVLVHELTHAMVASLSGRGLPTWMHEGLAQHFEGASVQAARRRLQARGQIIPLEELEATFMNLNAAGAQLAYDESLVAVEAMFERPRFTWAQLFNALAGSGHPAETLGSFGVGYPELEARLK